MIRARIPILLLSLVPWLIAAPTWGQQPPDRAPIPARTPQQHTAPAQSPKLATVSAQCECTIDLDSCKSAR